MSKGLRVTLLSICTVLGTAYAQFPDVPPEHYAEQAVSQLADLGIITGFPDGLFRGQKAVNRYELSLILTRMWHAWSTEQLNEVFSQLTTIELGVAQLEQQQAAFEERFKAVGNLEQRLGRSERAVRELDARTQRVGVTESAVGGLNAQLNQVQAQLKQNREDATRRLAALQSQISVGNRQATTLTGRLDTLTGRLETHQAQLEQTVADQGKASWRGTLSAAAGVAGSVADYRLGLNVVTQEAHIGVELTPVGPEVIAEVSSTGGVTLFGRHHLGSSGNQGALGVRFELVSGVGAGFYGGFDAGLAAGAFVSLGGDKQSALPGVLATLGALMDTSSAGGLGSKLLVQGVGGATFGGERFAITPRAFYRRQSGGDDHQLLGGELQVTTAQETFAVAAAARYGVATDLVTGESVGAPEAELRLALPSGAFSDVQLSGGLPDLDTLASFADGSPLQTEQLVLGVRVGVSLKLAELLR